MRYTTKRNGKNVIPLLNAVCALDMPYWRIDRADDLHSYLSGDAADRLAAYEDTGLSPEEIREMMTDWIVWKQAEVTGRLVVLPCKVGDTVYAVLEDVDSYGSYIVEDERISEAGSKGFWVSGIRDEPDEMHIFTPWSEIGKSVFLACEEAEKALEAQK